MPVKEKPKNKTIKSQASAIDETIDWKTLYESLLSKVDKLSDQVATLLLQNEKKDDLNQQLLEKIKYLEKTKSNDASKLDVKFDTSVNVKSKKVSFAKVVGNEVKKKEKVIKNDGNKITVKSIRKSIWEGKELKYYLEIENDEEVYYEWIASSQCDKSLENMIKKFHEENPYAPSMEDITIQEAIMTEKKNKKEIWTKIQKKNTKNLDAKDIGFIANSLVKPIQEPKKFDKVSFEITNKRILHKFSYKQKKDTFVKIFQQFGIYSLMARFSFVGNSIIEIYAIEENIETITGRMQNNGWTKCVFNPEEKPEFSSPDQEKIQKEALISRIAYLFNSTTIKNLQQAFLIGLKEGTVDKILLKVAEVNKQKQEKKDGLKDKKISIHSDLKFIQESKVFKTNEGKVGTKPTNCL